ncbi:MAG TPA: hypothetical protein VMX94_06110 [Armatimonadota bacterium]|nr:hypothetical protein [Armatimonadota bacterium]
MRKRIGLLRWLNVVLGATIRAPIFACLGAYGASAQAWDTKRAASDQICYPMAIVKIWKGSLCMINAAGFCTPMTDTATADMFCGVSAATIDNRYVTEGDSGSGAATAGDRSMDCWQTGVFTFKHAGAARTDVGLPAFWSGAVADAQQTVESATTAATHDFMVGQIVGVSAEASATRVRVKIDGYASYGYPEASVVGGYST